MEKSVRVADTRLAYTDHSAGAASAPPVLLLHPWFGCRQMWQPLVDRIDRRSLAVDWYSLAPTPGTATPHGLAAAALALLDAEGLDEVDVVGNSVGGVVAQLLAIEHPERVRRLVLVGTGASLGGRPTEFGALVSRWIDEPERRAELSDLLVGALVARPLPEAEHAAYAACVRGADPALVEGVLTSARRLDLRRHLDRIVAPTLVIRGEHDTARTPAHVAELLAGIPDAGAVEMAGCGHSPMVEEPDDFARLVRRHLDR
jgi:pimeloyl-ACP methyl ester carboxylesterase